MAVIQPIIFTDMDGSLLDHDTYSHAEADELLEWLGDKKIPVVPATSKTRAEVLKLRAQLNNTHPFIIENGAAIFTPLNYFSHDYMNDNVHDDYHVKAFVESRSHWQSLLKQSEVHLNEAFLSFADAGVAGVKDMTGLSLEEARLASQREYGEPLKWLGSDDLLNEFDQYISLHGGQLLRGGRFVHVSGPCDKGHALKWLFAKFQQHYSDKNTVSIAIGDSYNDVAMLEAADYAIIIRSPVHEFPMIKDNVNQKVVMTEQVGPRGWVEGVSYVLKDLGFYD